MTALESQRAVKIRGSVLGYFQPHRETAELTSVLETVRGELADVSDADVRDVILRLIGIGKLMYTSDMRISLAK
jgi:hypothetical protein